MRDFANYMIMLHQEPVWDKNKMVCAAESAEQFRQRVTVGFSFLWAELWNEGA